MRIYKKNKKKSTEKWDIQISNFHFVCNLISILKEKLANELYAFDSTVWEVKRTTNLNISLMKFDLYDTIELFLDQANWLLWGANLPYEGSDESTWLLLCVLSRWVHELMVWNIYWNAGLFVICFFIFIASLIRLFRILDYIFQKEHTVILYVCHSNFITSVDRGTSWVSSGSSENFILSQCFFDKSF